MMSKKLVFLVSTALCTVLWAGTAFAGEWIQNAGKWYYINSDETMKTGWHEEAGVWYYFGEDGAMLTDAVTPDGETVDSDGKWVQNAAATKEYKEPLKLYEMTPVSQKGTIGYGSKSQTKIYNGEYWGNSFVLYGGRKGLDRSYLEDEGNGYVVYNLAEEYSLLTASFSASSSMWGDLWYRVYVTGDHDEVLFESDDMLKEDVFDISVDISGHQKISLVVEGGRYNGLVVVKDLVIR